MSRDDSRGTIVVELDCAGVVCRDSNTMANTESVADMRLFSLADLSYLLVRKV